jgi:glycosyltransferase involved in cell wall biosynthesis
MALFRRALAATRADFVITISSSSEPVGLVNPQSGFSRKQIPCAPDYVTPSVSILIPCYNAAPWLAETLDSALAQTWPEKEIILVDDGSRDDSLAIARSYETRGVRVIKQTNRGASAARNRALQEARGDYLQFLDADDLLAPAKITHQMKLAGNIGSEHALCATWSRFTKSISDADFTPQRLCTDSAPVDWVVEKFECNAMMHPAAWLIPRILADRAGPWVETRSPDDDGEYFIRVVLASKGVRFCREAISYYRSYLPDSLSRAKSDESWAASFGSLQLAEKNLRAAEDSSRTRHACATAFQRYIYESYPRARACRLHARKYVATLGGSDLEPEGGPKFQLARRLFGWRLARRLFIWQVTRRIGT